MKFWAQWQSFLNAEYVFNVLICKRFCDISVDRDYAVHKRAFFGFKPLDFFFHRAFCNQAVYKNFLCLADTIGSVCCLIFNGRVPPRVVVNNIIRSSKVEPRSAGFKRYEENGNSGVGVEALDNFLTVFGRAREVFVLAAFCFKSLLNNIEHSDKLAEKQYPVPFGDDFFKHFLQMFKFTRLVYA